MGFKQLKQQAKAKFKPNYGYFVMLFLPVWIFKEFFIMKSAGQVSSIQQATKNQMDNDNLLFYIFGILMASFLLSALFKSIDLMRNNSESDAKENLYAMKGFKQSFTVLSTWHSAWSTFAIGFLKSLFTVLWALPGYLIMGIGIFLIIAKKSTSAAILSLFVIAIIYLIVIAIYKYVQYSQAQFIYHDHDKQISYLQAITESKKLMNDHIGEFILLNLSFIPWYILNYITFGLVGLFYSTPYINLTFANYYVKITKNGSSDQDSSFTENIVANSNK